MVDTEDYQFRINAHVLLGENSPVWEDDQDFLKAYNEVRKRTIVSPHRAYALFQWARQCSHLDGGFAQVGIYRGGSAQLIASQRNPKQPFYLFDTGEGLPEHDPAIDIYEQGKFGDVSIDDVTKLFADDPSVYFHEGIFPQTAAHIPQEQKFAFVYLDVDLYRSNYDGLEFFYPRMVPGGVIICDDYRFRNCPGIEKSLEDYIDEVGAKEVIMRPTRFQAVLVKLPEE